MADYIPVSDGGQSGFGFHRQKEANVSLISEPLCEGREPCLHSWANRLKIDDLCKGASVAPRLHCWSSGGAR